MATAQLTFEDNSLAQALYGEQGKHLKIVNRSLGVKTQVRGNQVALQGPEAEVRLAQRQYDAVDPSNRLVAAELERRWNEKLEHLLDIFIETGLSKIIVFRENLDNILGYIHTSEMFEKPVDWHSCITQIPMVPETMTANKLMKQLMAEKKSIAAVLDEFGAVAGIVTMEDLVEEIFGEIEDEHDTQTYISKQVGNNEYIFSGKIEIDKINAQFMRPADRFYGFRVINFTVTVRFFEMKKLPADRPPAKSERTDFNPRSP